MVETTAVASYFAERFDEPVAIRSLKQTFPGMSRETWIVGGGGGGGRPRNAIGTSCSGSTSRAAGSSRCR